MIRFLSGLDPEGFMTLYKFKKIINKTIKRHPEATANKLSDEYIAGELDLVSFNIMWQIDGPFVPYPMFGKTERRSFTKDKIIFGKFAMV